MAKIFQFPPANRAVVDHLAQLTQLKQRRDVLRSLLAKDGLLPVDRHAIEVMLIAIEAAIARAEATA